MQGGAANSVSTSPRLRGEVGLRSSPGEGEFQRVVLLESAPHLDPLPASGEREDSLRRRGKTTHDSAMSEISAPQIDA
jgi:hypothetical protein